jgi:hypothetical protein
MNPQNVKPATPCLRNDFFRNMTQRKAGTWLSYCVTSIKFEFLNGLFSLGSSSQLHDQGNDDRSSSSSAGQKAH